MSFFKPKKDQCSICSTYEQSLELEKSHEEHQERNVAARNEKEKDKERAQTDKSFHASAFDLPAVLTTPCSLVGELFYKRKLACYNISFYSLGSRKWTCYLWDETQGQRGYCEIAICLMMYINSVADRLSPVTEITLFSDTCGGQNRNQYVAAGLLYSLRNTPKLQYLMKCLERGHFEMEVDSIHSTIETAKKRTKVFVPSQWHTVVTMARKHSPYITIPIKYTDVLNLKVLVQECCPNMKVDINGEHIKWPKVKWILTVRRDHPDCIFVNYAFHEGNFFQIDTRVVRRRQSKITWPTCLSSCYNDKLPSI